VIELVEKLHKNKDTGLIMRLRSKEPITADSPQTTANLAMSVIPGDQFQLMRMSLLVNKKLADLLLLREEWRADPFRAKNQDVNDR